MKNIQLTNKIFSLSALFLLQACGGSSSDSTNINPDDFTPDVSQTGIIAYDEDLKISQAVDLFLYFPNDNISNINWQQTAGNSVIFHADNSKGIAFTPSTAGEYSFQVSFTRNGSNEQLSHTINVENSNSQISARLGHAVLEGNKISLRTSIESDSISTASIQWQQTSGPTITFSDTTAGQEAIFFTAPQVSTDSLLEFTVSASDGSTTYQDTVAVLVENAPTISTDSNNAYDDRLARVFPYNDNSPYADVLVDCVYSNTIDFSNTCRLNQLPLIAHDSTSPTVNDIMNRVVVSHKWMGQRFKEFLENSDQFGDFKNLLRATTAIVISYDVRPSYYWAVTGAIHLDPNNLWLTPGERDTINQAPDFRASFGDSLNFVMPWRYVKDNSYASFYYPDNVRVTRDAADGVNALAALMYHELAHANDYFPQSEWANMNRNDRILDNAQQRQDSTGIASDMLATALPLNGDEMYRLARVRYHGETATDTEQNYSPSDVTGFFSPEQSPHFYNYSSKREDYAMLFDELMMKIRYNVDRDIAVTNQPQSDDEEFIVMWGQRGRIGENNIRPRVEYVTRKILPEFSNVAEAVRNLAQPIGMSSGKTWAENLAISPQTNRVENKDAIESPLNRGVYYRRNANGTAYYEKPLPTKH